MSEQKRNLAPAGMQFRTWLFLGTGGRPGWRNLVGTFTGAQIVLALGLSAVVKRPLHEIAATIVLPMASIAVALAFAWGAASLPLLTTKPVRTMGRKVSGGLPEYANYFQLAIMVVMLTLVGWGLAAAGPYGLTLFGWRWGHIEGFVLFFMTAVAFTECWGVINFARELFLSVAALEDSNDDIASLETAKARVLSMQPPTSSGQGHETKVEYVAVADADR